MYLQLITLPWLLTPVPCVVLMKSIAGLSIRTVWEYFPGLLQGRKLASEQGLLAVNIQCTNLQEAIYHACSWIVWQTRYKDEWLKEFGKITLFKDMKNGIWLEKVGGNRNLWLDTRILKEPRFQLYLSISMNIYFDRRLSCSCFSCTCNSKHGAHSRRTKSVRGKLTNFLLNMYDYLAILSPI